MAGDIMRKMTGHLSFARALFGMNLKASLAERGAFVLQVLFMMLNNVTFFVFWWALMHRVPTLRGWRLGDIQLLFGIVAASFGLAVVFGGGVRQLGRFVHEGELDTLLTQPRAVLPYALGMRLQASGVGDFVSGIVFVTTSGVMSWGAVPVTAVAIIASALVIVASGVVFFSLAFWLGQVETLSRQLWELLITFSLYPEPLFGGALRFVLFTLLPAGFIGYVPVHVARGSSVWLAAGLVAAASVYVALAFLVFHRGIARYASGSRFGTFG
jgi:ABC-2 type transport system permease protein